MMKNILKRLDNTLGKTFAFAFLLVLILGVGFHFASATRTQTLPFVGTPEALTNKIGSLSVGTERASWIQSGLGGVDPKCLTSQNREELQTCLDVAGVGFFSRLIGNNVPAFFQGKLVVGGTGTVPAGREFIVKNTGGEDSIIASSLWHLENGSFSPRDTTSLTRLCADSEGVLYPCEGSQPAETYHWDTGNWSTCSGTCSGEWTTTGAGTCSGTWTDGICTISNDCSIERLNTWWEQISNSEIKDSCPEVGLPIPVRESSDEEYEIHATSVQDCKDKIEYVCTDEAPQYDNPLAGDGTCDAFDSGSYEIHLAFEEFNNITHSCSDSNPQNEQDCTSQNQNCQWTDGSSTTHSCSDKNGTDQATCEAYNDACSWDAGTKTRTVVCKNGQGDIVSDQLCIDNVGPKPATTQNCS